MDLSVVVIARNEEAIIGKSIESVFAAVEDAKAAKVINSFEVIFVDSASTDQTVQIAKRYPVKILRLKEDWPLSTAAGIYTGYKAASGTFLGIVDGDVEVDLNWFRDALPYLQADEKIGCVYGWWEEGSDGNGYLFQSMMQQLNTLKILSPKEVDFVGNGIFNKTALDLVGGHNPFLKGAEDKDISYRLRLGGFKLLQIPVRFGTHYWHFSVLEYYQSLRVWSLGDGHAAAYARKSGNLELFRFYKGNYSNVVLFRCLRHGLLFVLWWLSLTLAILDKTG